VLWWNDTDRGENEWIWRFGGMILTGERKLAQCHFANHKSHMDWPGNESGPPCGILATNLLVKVKVNVKFAIVRAMKAQKGSRSIALLFL
jgi:hypothetical protein